MAEESAELTPQQERDVEDILNDYDWGLNDTDLHTESLAQKLEAAESANIHAILQSEAEVENLLEGIDQALDMLGCVEECVTVYDREIQLVRQEAQEVTDLERNAEIHSGNQELLFLEVQSVVAQLDFDPQSIEALQSGDLANVNTVKLCIEAVRALQDKLNLKVAGGIAALETVHKRTVFFRALQETFANRFVNFFFELLKEMIEQKTVHETRRRRLYPYMPLFPWLRNLDPDSDFSRFASVSKAYGDALQPVYYAMIQDECQQACKASQLLKGKASSSEILQRRLVFDTAFEELLKSLVQAYSVEQKFCRDMFFTESSGHCPERIPNSLEAGNMSSSLKDQQGDSLAAILFSGLNTELLTVVDAVVRVDPFCSMLLVHRLQNHASFAKVGKHDYLYGCLTQAFSASREMFDMFRQQLIRSIEETKSPGKKKVGILPILDRLSQVLAHSVKLLEVIVNDGGTMDRTLVDDMMTEAMNAAELAVVRIAVESKYRDVVLFENFHRIYDQLSQLKIECLQPFKTAAQQKYRENLSLYVQSILGHPMEKLTTFFEGVERLIQSGTSAEEVGYQMKFSKQELFKCIAAYPGKEVKKNLEAMYKKVSGHLSEEENLLVVVWRNIQEEFVKQYQVRCSAVSLERVFFTCFSYIAWGLLAKKRHFFFFRNLNG